MAAWWLTAAPQQPAAPRLRLRALKFVGDGPCFQCHYRFADEWARVKGHSDKILAMTIAEPLANMLTNLLRAAPPFSPTYPFAPSMPSSCETCHGPGNLHVGGVREMIVRWQRFGRPQDASAPTRLHRARQEAICLPCHTAIFERRKEDWQLSPHRQPAPGKSRSVSARTKTPTCTDCHEVHHPRKIRAADLMRLPMERNCTQAGCHDDILRKSAPSVRLHHPLRYETGKHKGMTIVDWRKEGASYECGVCHTPHGNKELWQLRSTPEKPSRRYLRLSAAEQREENFASVCGNCHTGQPNEPRAIGYDRKDHGDVERKEWTQLHQTPERWSSAWVRQRRRGLRRDAYCVLCHGPNSCAGACHRAGTPPPGYRAPNGWGWQPGGIYVHKPQS